MAWRTSQRLLAYRGLVLGSAQARAAAAAGAAGSTRSQFPKWAVPGSSSALGWAPRRGFADLPAHTQLQMPSLSPTMTQGNIAQWRKKEGAAIAPGDVLAEVETDKATIDWESQEEGFLAKIILGDGSKDIPVGAPVAIMVEEEGDVAAFANYTGGGAAPAAAAAPKQQQQQQPAPPPPSGGGGSFPAHDVMAMPALSPTMAAGNILEWRKAVGDAVTAGDVLCEVETDKATISWEAQEEGYIAAILLPNGSKDIPIGTPAAVIVEDRDSVAAFAGYTAAVPGGEWTDEAVTQVKRVTAARLLESKQTIPHYYLTMECEVDALLALRAQVNQQLGPGGVKLSVNDFVVKAAALALRKVPAVNASWMGDFVRVFHNVDVNVAVQTPGGLMVPFVADADAKGLAAISAEVKALAAKAKDGKLAPAEFMGGTFTISNLGMFGIRQFAAIVNPPQAAILAVGAAAPKVVKGPAGEWREVHSMLVTLSCDHRVIDGAVGSEWLQAFKAHIESPLTMMV